MRHFLSLIAAFLFSVSFVYGKDAEYDAVILNHDAVFTMNSLSSGTYEVNSRILVNSKHGLSAATFNVFTDSFRTLSSFSGRIESGGKTLRKLKMSDLITVLIAEGVASDSYVSAYEPSGPYPFIVEYTYKVSYKKGMVSFPAFIPVTDPDVSVKSASYVLSVPAGTDIIFKASDEPLKTSEGKTDIYRWEVNDFGGFVSEPQMPDIRELVPFVYSGPASFQYSGTEGSQRNWGESGLWLYDLQKDVRNVPEELKNRITDLVSGMEDDRHKIKAIYDFLRENTRYVSIQLGIGGLKPFPVETVYKTGFGDCKALSTYMQALLAVAGIPSDYFIVDTKEADLLEGFYSVGQMNHAMLCVPMGKDSLWVECTNPRYPLGYRHDAVAGHQVVLVKKDGGEMVRVRPYADSLRLRAESLEVVLNQDGSASCKGTRRLVLDNVEPYIGFKSLDSKTQFNMIMYSNSINPSDFKITSFEDNFDSWADMDHGEEYIPEVRIGYSFGVSRYGKVSGNRIFIDLNPFAKSLVVSRNDRVNDFELKTGQMIVDAIRINLPSGYVLESIPCSETLESPFGTFENVVTYDEATNHIDVIQTIEIKSGRYSDEAYDEYRAFASGVSKSYGSRVVLVKK